MKVRGVKVWADFCRLGLMDLCRKTELELKTNHPEEYLKIYGKGP